MAKVIPIPKKGNSKNVQNYRSISLLSIVAILFEKLIKVQMMCFLNSFNFFSKSQFGFREGLGTELALRKFISEISNNINRKDMKRVAGMFLHIRKAFDTVNYEILLRKLELAGLRGLPLAWFNSYLHGRSQAVKVGSKMSSFQEMTCGVPQGSVLGPILFLIYINDLYSGPFKGKFTVFADDTALSYGAGSDVELYGDMSHDLKLLSLWFSFNKSSLNIEKTSYLNFGISCSFRLLSPLKFHSVGCAEDHCGCGVIKQSRVVKYLGLSVDDNMMWKSHIDSMKKYSRCLLHRLHHLKRLCPRFVLRNIYFALSQSHLSYGLVCWGSTYMTHLKSLITLQKSMVCLIDGGCRRGDFLNACQSLDVMPLRYLYVFKVLTQFLSGTEDGAFIQAERHYSTRVMERLCTPQPFLTFFQKSFLFLQGRFYNRLPQDIIDSAFLRHCFKIYLRRFLLTHCIDEIEGWYQVVD